MLHNVPTVISPIKIKASISHCFFEKVNAPAKASGKSNRGSFSLTTDSHSFLSSLHSPEINGNTNNRLMLHKIGDEKKRRKWPRRSLCKKADSTNAIIKIESNALEKNTEAIMPMML